MVRRSIICALLIAAALVSGLSVPAQIQLDLRREIHLPVPKSRGTYDHFPIIELAARDHFAWRIAPDQSVLIFDSDTSGNWPLVRVKKWWTENPVSEVLGIRGWKTADKKDLAAIQVDVQVTPDGHYAVALSQAVWRAKSNFLFHAPAGHVQRPSDAIITAIDLHRWQIVKSIHTATLGEIQIRDARVVNSGWIAWDDAHLNQSPNEYGAYPFSNRLLSIPDLTPGPQCIFQRVSHMWRKPPDSVVESLSKQNNQACREVLKATGLDSENALEALIQRGSDVEPDAMRIHILDAVASALPGEADLWHAEEDEEEFFRYWGDYPYYENYAENPPFESSAHLWYGLYGSDVRGLYQLDRYDAEGVKQKSRTIGSLLCGDPSLGSPKLYCGCRVVDVSEESKTLLAYCRTQHGDYGGMIQRQWLAAFRSDDLSDVGVVNLGNDVGALQAIGNGDGHAYVLTLNYGETLRIYAIPDRP